MVKIYIGHKTTFLFGEEKIIINLQPQKENLEKAGFEVEEVEFSKAIERAYEILRDFQNG